MTKYGLKFLDGSCAIPFIQLLKCLHLTIGTYTVYKLQVCTLIGGFAGDMQVYDLQVPSQHLIPR